MNHVFGSAKLVNIIVIIFLQTLSADIKLKVLKTWFNIDPISWYAWPPCVISRWYPRMNINLKDGTVVIMSCNSWLILIRIWAKSISSFKSSWPKEVASIECISAIVWIILDGQRGSMDQNSNVNGSTVQHSAIHCSTVQYMAIQRSTG